jgi:hypothetical protein
MRRMFQVVSFRSAACAREHQMRRPIAVAGAIALAIGLAACSSSGSSSGTSGTETLTGEASGTAAANQLNSNSNAPLAFQTLVFTGPVATSMSNPSLGSGKSATATHTFVTPAGNFTVTRTVTSKGQAQPSVTAKTGSTCYFKQNAGGGTYTVDGSKSTGKFAGATGSGTFATTIVAAADLLPGKTTCTTDNTGNVIPKGASITFKASGPLTLKS